MLLRSQTPLYAPNYRGERNTKRSKAPFRPCVADSPEYDSLSFVSYLPLPFLLAKIYLYVLVGAVTNCSVISVSSKSNELYIASEGVTCTTPIWLVLLFGADRLTGSYLAPSVLAGSYWCRL